MSNINDIMTALAAKSLTVNSKAITGLTGSTIPNGAKGRTPVRIITSLSPYIFENVTAADVYGMDSGSGRREIDWQIADLLLWEPAGSNTGPNAHDEYLNDYTEAYIDMLAADTALGAYGVVGILPTWDHNIYEYPPGSGAFFYGVLVNLAMKVKRNG